MELKRKISKAIEMNIASYYQPDGTGFKKGETLPPEDAPHFQGWIQGMVTREIGHPVIVELGDEDESILITPITADGEKLTEQSAFFKYELGTQIDLDGDGY